MGYSPWGRKESDTTEWLHFHFQGLFKSPCHSFIYWASWKKKKFNLLSRHCLLFLHKLTWYILKYLFLVLYFKISDFCQWFPNSGSYVRMWELDYEENWEPKNWCFWTVVLEKTLENPSGSKEIRPVNPRGNQSILNIHWKAWYWSSSSLVTWCKELTHWKRPWRWKRLGARG